MQRWAKRIKSLQIKKNRKAEQSFVVEGGKSVLEVVRSGLDVEAVLVTEAFWHENAAELRGKNFAVERTDAEMLARLGTFQTNDAALAVVRMPPNRKVMPGPDGLLLALDGVQDPGNLGTLVRIADWYGADGVVCSHDTVDLYNPKTIAATMGSFTRVPVYYCDLAVYLADLKQRGATVYGAFLDGESVHGTLFATPAVLLMGSEAHGIRPALEEAVTRRVSIPRFGGAESLNVAIAAAVICDNWRRG